MGMENPEFQHIPIDPEQTKDDGWVLVNGVWRKYARKEDIELTKQGQENENEQKGQDKEDGKQGKESEKAQEPASPEVKKDVVQKETPGEDSPKRFESKGNKKEENAIDKRLRQVEKELEEIDNKAYISPDDKERKRKLEIEYTELDRQPRETREEKKEQQLKKDAQEQPVSPEKPAPPDQTKKREEIPTPEAQRNRPKEGPESLKEDLQGQTKERIVRHFQEELEKLKDSPRETEHQKRNTMDLCQELIQDWLPLGFLDNFKGASEALEIMETCGPQLGRLKEEIASSIAYEMAFQYGLWGLDDKAKTEIIGNFVDRWLKDKSPFYQRGEAFQHFLTSDSPFLGTISHSLEKEGDNIVKHQILNKPPDRSWAQKWFYGAMASWFKNRGARDRVLSEISQILAAENIPYKNFQRLTDRIENQSIKQEAVAQLLQIEEQVNEEKLIFLAQEKERIGTLPDKELKIRFFEDLIKEKIAKGELSPEQAEWYSMLLDEFQEGLQDKETMERLGRIKTCLDQIAGKQAEQIPSDVKPIIDKVKESIKTEEGKKTEAGEKKETSKKKGTGLGISMEMFGYPLVLFLILFLLGEIKLIEKMSDINPLGGKKK